MARPAKSTATQSRHSTNEEKKRRKEAESVLKGAADQIKPPGYLNRAQKSIFRKIVRELEASGILGNLDIYILSQCSIAIDRLQVIEDMINKRVTLLYDKDLMASKDKYSKDLYRCCNELSLSPQSRAKMAGINSQAKKEKDDPLLKILKGGKPDDKTASGV